MGHVDIFFGHGCSVVSVLPVAGVMRGDGRSKSHPPFTWRWSVFFLLRVRDRSTADRFQYWLFEGDNNVGCGSRAWSGVWRGLGLQSGCLRTRTDVSFWIEIDADLDFMIFFLSGFFSD